MLIDSPEDREGMYDEGELSLPPVGSKAKSEMSDVNEEMGRFVYPGSRSRSIRPGTAPRSAYIVDAMAEMRNPKNMLEVPADDETVAMWMRKYPTAFDSTDALNVPDASRGEVWPEAFDQFHPANLIPALEAKLRKGIAGQSAVTIARIDAALDALLGTTPDPEDALSQKEPMIPISRISGYFAAQRGARRVHTVDPSETLDLQRAVASQEIHNIGFAAVNFMRDILRERRDADSATQN